MRVTERLTRISEWAVPAFKIWSRVTGRIDEQFTIPGFAFALIAVLLLFLSTTALAKVAHGLAFGLLLLQVLVLSISLPRLAIIALVMLTPVQALAEFTRTDMHWALAVLLTGINLAQIGHLGREFLKPVVMVRHIPLLLLFLAFLLLLIPLQALFSVGGLNWEDIKSSFGDWVFLVLLFGAALSSVRIASVSDGRSFRGGLLIAIFYALILTVAVDVFAMFFPSIEKTLGLVRDWPGIRMAGLHVNPNATAKYLAAGAMVCMACLWSRFTLFGSPIAPRIASGLALGIFSAALAATGSKGAQMGLLVAVGASAAVFLLRRRFDAGILAGGGFALILVTALGYDMVAALDLNEVVKERHFAAEGVVPPAEEDTEATTTKVLSQLRVTKSYDMVLEPPAPAPTPAGPSDKVAAAPQTPNVAKPSVAKNSDMYANIGGHIEYTARDCGWSCTGQRDRLWRAAFDIIRDNWLIGIGPTHWGAQYLVRTQFPFDSPHNVVLELWGSFGLAGLALYIGFTVSALIRITRAFPTEPGTVDTIYDVAVRLFLVAMMVTEWVDPAKFFTANPHAIWLWIMIAALPVQAGPSERSSIAGR